jgi:carbonic anhydrase
MSPVARVVPARPLKELAVLTCMDARLAPARLLGLGPGDAHVLRNAGGVVTADVIESLGISQERLGTRKVVVIGHTDCAGLAARLPGRSTAACVRTAVRLLREAPGLNHRDHVRGYVLDVESGTLAEVGPTEVAAAPATAPAAAPPAPAPLAPPLAHCGWCGRAFGPGASWRRSGRRYCSDPCRLAARAGRGTAGRLGPSRGA